MAKNKLVGLDEKEIFSDLTILKNEDPKLRKKIASQLTAKELLVANFYLEGYSKKQSFAKAGYAASTVNSHNGNLFTKTHFKQYLAIRQKEIEEQTVLSIQYLESELMRFYNLVKEEENRPLQLKCLELMLKHKQNSLANIENNTTSNVQINLNYVNNTENEDKVIKIDIE